MKRFWFVLLLPLLAACPSKFQADLDYEVDASVNIGQMQVIHNDSGVLYDWFYINNAFSESEAALVTSYYDEMVRVMRKLRTKAIAGQVDYHRLLYAVEDLTEAWQKLRPELQVMVNIVQEDPGRLEDRLAIAMWNRLSSDMDSILASANVTLKNARDAADQATYEAFRKDAQSIVKVLSPLVKALPLPGI